MDVYWSRAWQEEGAAPPWYEAQTFHVVNNGERGGQYQRPMFSIDAYRPYMSDSRSVGIGIFVNFWTGLG